MSRGQAAQAAQVKTITRWANRELSEAGYLGGGAKPVEDLPKDMRDGIKWIQLVATTTGQAVPKYCKKCTLPVQMMDNVGIALRMAHAVKGIRLQGVGSQDIVDEDLRMNLAFAWAIIYAQMHRAIQGEGGKTSGREGLLLWAKRATAGYEGVPDIKDFRGSWSSGHAFAALLAKHDVVDYDAVAKLSVTERIQRCITAASEKLGVAALIDASDMKGAVDEKITMLYISEFLKYFSRQQSVDQGKKRIAGFVATQRAIDELVRDYGQKARLLLGFATEHLDRIAALPAAAELLPAQQQLDAENRFQKGELAAKRHDKASLDRTLASLQTTLSCNGRHAYKPAGELALDWIESRWAELEAAAAAAQDAARAKYRSAREQVGKLYVELSKELFGELTRLLDSQRALQGDDPDKQLAELEALRDGTNGLQERMPKMRAVADELASAHVNTDDIAGLQYGADDLELRLASLHDALERNLEFLAHQAEQKKGSAVSQDKQAEIGDTFKHFDKNGNGTLNRAEFIGALKGLGRDYSDEEATSLFNKHSDGGDITFDVFMSVMTSLETSTQSRDEILQSVAGLAGGSVLTKEELAEQLGPETAEYLATMAPRAPGGRLDLKACVAGVFAATTAPPVCPGSPIFAASAEPESRASGLKRQQSVRGKAAGTSFAKVDPLSDDELNVPEVGVGA